MSDVGALEDFLAKLDAPGRARFQKWFNSRPDPVKQMVRDYPPDTVLLIRGKLAWIVSYQEVKDGPSGLQLSFINPLHDYDEAVRTRFYLCADHLKGAP